MATVTGANVIEWKMKEMARKACVKYDPEGKTNPFAGMDKAQLKEQKSLIKQAKKESKK